MSWGDRLNAVRDSRTYDRVMRLPTTIYSFYVLGHDMLGFYHEAQNDPVAWTHADFGLFVGLLARVSQWMFVALLGILPLIRHRPIARSNSALPRLIALVTVLIPPLCMLLPRAPANLAFDLASVVVGLVTNLLAVTALSFLGRSFSVMPEARRLVTTGPYGIVRHPLYLFELLGVLGILLQVRSPAGGIALALIVMLQVMRARWEEEVLANAIPEFADYCRRVPFLLPHNPERFIGLLWNDPAARRRCGVVMSLAFGMVTVVMIAMPLLTS